MEDTKTQTCIRKEQAKQVHNRYRHSHRNTLYRDIYSKRFTRGKDAREREVIDLYHNRQSPVSHIKVTQGITHPARIGITR